MLTIYKDNSQDKKRFLPKFSLFTYKINRKIGILHTGILLLLAVPLWLSTEVIVSQVAHAYTDRVELQIDRLQDESYENILERAKLAARAATQRSFERDILITEVYVTISAQNRGAIAPILQLQVTRPQWRQRPDPKIWSTYFKTSRSLLSFDQNTPLVPETTVTIPNNQTPDNQSEPAPENQRLRD